MSLQISDTALVGALALMLAGCSAPEDATAIPKDSRDDSRIACAIAGADDLSSTCLLERVRVDGRLQLVVRHPDGGFRRFNVVSDGRGIEAADGSETAFVQPLDDAIEVVVGADRYRFPATVRGADIADETAN